MMMVLFCIFVALFQIYLLIRAIKKPNLDNFIMLFVVSICSIMSVILPYGIEIFDIYPLGFNFIMIYLVDIVSIPLSFLVLIIGVIAMIINKSNDKIKNEKSINLSKALIVFLVILELLLPSVLILSEIKHYDNLENREKNDISSEVIKSLNDQFGNGNFKVDNIRKSTTDIFGNGVTGYIFTISSDYMNDTFDVLYNTDDNKIESNTFLEKYYSEKNNISNLNEYLIDYKSDLVSKVINEKYNVKISFHYNHVSSLVNNYGKVPSIDELLPYVVLNKAEINFLDEFNDKDVFLDYLVDFTNFYIINIENTYVNLDQISNEYFRFDYDYTKLGIRSVTNNKSSYPGYVIKEDNNIRINFYTITKTYSLDEINKKTTE